MGGVAFLKKTKTSMNLLSVRCNHCGAPLEVAESARYVTCQFCNSQLSVQRTGTAVSTEVLGEIAQNTERMAENLEIIRIQNDITALDREWEMEREKYMIRGENGAVTEPGSGVATIFFSVIAICFGVFWMVSVSNMGGGNFSLFGLFFIVAAFGNMVGGVSKANGLRAARGNYAERHLALERDLLNAKRAAGEAR